jgi:hypothetical protein
MTLIQQRRCATCDTSYGAINTDLSPSPKGKKYPWQQAGRLSHS